MNEDHSHYVPVFEIPVLFGFDRGRMRQVMDDYTAGTLPAGTPSLDAILIRNRTRYKIDRTRFLEWYRAYLYAKVDAKIEAWREKAAQAVLTPAN